jgi:hypothetical protein
LHQLNQELEAKVALRSEKRMELNTFLHAVLETLPFGVVVLDNDQQVSLRNSLFRTLLDYPDTLLLKEPLERKDWVGFNFGGPCGCAAAQRRTARCAMPSGWLSLQTLGCGSRHCADRQAHRPWAAAPFAVPCRSGTPIRFKGSSKKLAGSAGECDRQAADTGFKRKLKAVHTACCLPAMVPRPLQ